ncbi:MAG: hypothetical protein IJM19_07970 [Ruminococcus sp.]|nr:hypothetical protein [Ruminococcus sp.]
MRKFFSIAVASLLIVSSFASCGSSETETASSSSSSKVADDAAQEEVTEEETTEEETEEETTEEATEEETTESEEVAEEETTTTAADGEEATTLAGLPEIVPDTVAETDFAGKWECVRLVSSDGTPEGTFDSDSLGVSIPALMQVEINADYTAAATSSFDSADADSSMTWTYTENTISLLDSEGESIEGVIQGGELVIYDDEMQLYLKKVDEFTEVSEEDVEKFFMDMLGSMGVDLEEGGSEITDDTAVETTAGAELSE